MARLVVALRFVVCGVPSRRGDRVDDTTGRTYDTTYPRRCAVITHSYARCGRDGTHVHVEHVRIVVCDVYRMSVIAHMSLVIRRCRNSSNNLCVATRVVHCMCYN